MATDDPARAEHGHGIEVPALDAGGTAEPVGRDVIEVLQEPEIGRKRFEALCLGQQKVARAALTKRQHGVIPKSALRFGSARQADLRGVRMQPGGAATVSTLPRLIAGRLRRYPRRRAATWPCRTNREHEKPCPREKVARILGPGSWTLIALGGSGRLDASEPVPCPDVGRAFRATGRFHATR
ncbi:MAG: hypothetical protein JWR00_21 [Rubritepida sp.]|nr:hypothetical protein [Rubritepida sp.]